MPPQIRVTPLPDEDDFDMVRSVSFTRAAELWDVSESTVRRLIERGELRTVVIHTKRRIPMTELRDYMARNAAVVRLDAARRRA